MTQTEVNMRVCWLALNRGLDEQRERGYRPVVEQGSFYPT